jgi:alkylation response protein AidB-like acyl-CoA dehydrogenase
MRFEPTELSDAELVLRAEVRDFLAEALPRGSYEPGLGMAAQWRPDFSRELGRRGWLGMALPVEYGGGGRSAVERLVVVEQLLAVGAPVAFHWVADRQTGPSIARFGTEEQKRFFLPRIARGELSFCIGMSEPEAGSDLAAVRTRAERVDGGWLINGTKVWTSWAAQADYVLGLFRTSPDRHAGLTQMIVPTDAPGLAISAIPFVDGTAEFCELSFIDVFVPDERVLGEVGAGWAQNTAELALERGGVDRWMSGLYLAGCVLDRCRDDGGGGPGEMFGDFAARAWAYRGMSLSVARMVDDGRSPSAEAALVKEMGTRFEQDVVDALARIMPGPLDPGSTDAVERLLAKAVLVAPSWTIRGGTNEILRTVIAKGLRQDD